MNEIRILFIGNSHTYCNDLPKKAADIAGADGYNVSVTMLAHGGWFLEQHSEEPETIFNIQYGKYDFMVLQEHSHPFAPFEKYSAAVKKLSSLAKSVNTVPVIYETWAAKNESEKQCEMNKINEQIAAENNALLAPVGEFWFGNIDIDSMYAEDGQHASNLGSQFAARIIWNTVLEYIISNKEKDK